MVLHANASQSEFWLGHIKSIHSESDAQGLIVHTYTLGWTKKEQKFRSSVYCFLPQLILRLDNTNKKQKKTEKSEYYF